MLYFNDWGIFRSTGSLCYSSWETRLSCLLVMSVMTIRILTT